MELPRVLRPLKPAGRSPFNSGETTNSWLKQINPRDPGLLLDGNDLCQLVSNTVANNCIVFVPTSDSKAFYLFQELP
jgi:hypothetical protein